MRSARHKILTRAAILILMLLAIALGCREADTAKGDKSKKSKPVAKTKSDETKPEAKPKSDSKPKPAKTETTTPSPEPEPKKAAPSPTSTPAKPASIKDTENEKPKQVIGRAEALVASLSIFALAIFVGFEVITKVPPTLHTPLMSGSNAISGITLVGAVLAAGTVAWNSAAWLGFIAVVLAALNVVGGFLVTHRMLSMFKKR